MATIPPPQLENPDLPNPRTWADLEAAGKRIRAGLDRVWEFDQSQRILTYLPRDYGIDVGRIRSYADLLNWVIHLLRKGWMNSILTNEFIRRVALIKKWNLHIY